MANKFLSGLISKYLTGLEDPVMPLDAVNLQTLEIMSPPPDGTAGQVLKKISNTPYDMEWANNNNGGGNGGGNALIHGGYFTQPNNANIHGGYF